MRAAPDFALRTPSVPVRGVLVLCGGIPKRWVRGGVFGYFCTLVLLESMLPVGVVYCVLAAEQLELTALAFIPRKKKVDSSGGCVCERVGVSRPIHADASPVAPIAKWQPERVHCAAVFSD